LFLLNLVGIRRILRKPSGRSMALSVVYGCGLLGGIYWTLYDFAWWKCLSIVVALFFFVYSLKRSNRPEAGPLS
jgi:hypothetical protein